MRLNNVEEQIELKMDLIRDRTSESIRSQRYAFYYSYDIGPKPLIPEMMQSLVRYDCNNMIIYGNN
jgi:hypothetical protein